MSKELAVLGSTQKGKVITKCKPQDLEKIRKLFDWLDCAGVSYLYGDQLLFMLIVILHEDISKEKVQVEEISEKVQMMLSHLNVSKLGLVSYQNFVSYILKYC